MLLFKAQKLKSILQDPDTDADVLELQISQRESNTAWLQKLRICLV
jgi:hypothetical protein